MRGGRVRLWIGTFLLALAGSTLAGCKNKDLVENELRARDVQFREAVEELNRSDGRNAALQREIEALRKGAPISPELAAQTFGLKRIVLGRGTGGYDNDGLPGDEALQIILEPRDQDDHAIKAPGTLHILALEITFQGIKTPLSSWVIDPGKLQKSWKQGLLSTGYNLTLPWKNLPRNENLRIVARLVLPDGRVFEADKDIKVRLVPGASRPLEGFPECPVEDPFAFPPEKGSGKEPSQLTPVTFLKPGENPASPTRWQAIAPHAPAPSTPTTPTPTTPTPTTPTPTTPAPTTPTRWEAAPLDNVIRLGRPQSVNAPAPPPEIE